MRARAYAGVIAREDMREDFCSEMRYLLCKENAGTLKMIASYEREKHIMCDC